MIQKNDTRKLIRQVARSVAPPPDLTVSDWADAERRLSVESSAEPGRWDTSRAEYQRGIMDAFCDPLVETVVCMTSAQVGKTEILNNVVGFFSHHDPSPIMILQPTLELAEAYSKDRLAPMIRDTPALRARIHDSKARNTGNTLLHKKVSGGGHITLAGSNSPASLASRPIRILLLDEIDRYGITPEGDPVNLARKRTNNFYNRKVGAFSTPTTKGTSRVEALYLQSDQRKFFVACPHCRREFVFRFEQLKYQKDDPSTTVLICPECTAIIDEAEKPKMISLGRWRATAPFHGLAGFHLNEMYSPWRRWSEIVADFFEAKQNPETLKVWINTSLGETWEEKGDAPDWKRLYDRRLQYKIGSVPDGGRILVAGADVQADRIEVEVVAFGEGLRTWSVDYRVFPGNTATEAPWLSLEELMRETFEGADGLQYAIKMLAVDSGFNTQHVYNWVRKFPPNRVIAIKGRDNLGTMVGRPSHVDVNVRGKKIARGLMVWPVGTNIIKSELYGILRLETPGKEDPIPPAWANFPEYPEEFFKQLCAEKLVIKRNNKGFSRYEWEKSRERNEALDCRVYARACAAILGADRIKPETLRAQSAKQPEPISQKNQASEKPIGKKRRRSSSDFWS